MTDTPEKLTIVDSPEMHVPQGATVTLTPAEHQDVALAALGTGVAQGVGTGVGMGFLNVLWQETNPKLSGIKRLISQREKFVFEAKSFNKWTAIGIGAGFAVGAVTSAIGAIHHNRELARTVSTPASGERTL